MVLQNNFLCQRIYFPLKTTDLAGLFFNKKNGFSHLAGYLLLLLLKAVAGKETVSYSSFLPFFSVFRAEKPRKNCELEEFLSMKFSIVVCRLAR